jgi:transcriptional regulator with GAF, ATPase, and Fis domain
LRRLAVIDELLTTLAGVLDVRDVFVRMSDIAARVVGHDAITVLALTDDREHVVPYAIAGVTPAETPPAHPLPPAARHLVTDPWEFEIIEDVQADAGRHPPHLVALGYRSLLRVPVHVQGRVDAILAIMSKAPRLYGLSDVPVAKRIADYVALALSHQRLAEHARQAEEFRLRAAKLESRVRVLTDDLNARAGYGRIIGDTPGWRQALTEATRVAGTETTVLLLGESGTGKEVAARFIHRASARAGGPFVALNCAALPEQLLEAELFGYERGAFTGATQSKPGQLEQAAGGVLFLDEVGEMSVSAQAKFLRVLEQREFQRLGGTRVLRTDARVVAATNRDLPKAIERGQFREDLFYRLNVFAIRLPPLRERIGDVLPLSEAFIAEIGRSIGRPPAGISREARQALLDYRWPGNVRELRNILERAAILCDGGLIAAEHLAFRPAAAPAAGASTVRPGAIPRNLESVERGMIERALKDAHFNKSEAARSLGITRAQLYVRLRRHCIDCS